MRRKIRGFTLVELLIVIAIIVTLIALLLPALTKARIQARYVGWQAFSKDMAVDPHCVMHWNFQNDQGTQTFTNDAFGYQVQNNNNYVGSELDAGITEWTAWGNPLPSEIQAAWSQSGRWPGKPAYTMSSASQHLWPYLMNAGQLSKILNNSQQASVVFWLYVPQAEQANQTSAVFWWCSSNSGPNNQVLGVSYWTGGTLQFYAGNNGSGAASWAGVNPLWASSGSNWVMVAATKDAPSGVVKMYINGVLMAIDGWNTANNSSQYGNSFNSEKFKGGDVVCPPTSSDHYTFTMCQLVGSPRLDCTIDELTIFDQDLDPGNLTIGSTSARFNQMYLMGMP